MSTFVRPLGSTAIPSGIASNRYPLASLSPTVMIGFTSRPASNGVSIGADWVMNPAAGYAAVATGTSPAPRPRAAKSATYRRDRGSAMDPPPRGRRDAALGSGADGHRAPRPFVTASRVVPGGTAPRPERSGRRRQPVRQLGCERRERQRAVAEHRVVECPQIEPGAVARRQLVAQPLDLALPDLVRQRLARPADVAVRLDRRVGLRQPGVEEEVDRALAVPAQRVEPGVDDKPCRAPRHRVEHAEALRLGSVEAHLRGELLAVEAPALDVGAADDPRAEAAERDQVRVLHLQRDLEVVPRDGLVV